MLGLGDNTATTRAIIALVIVSLSILGIAVASAIAIAYATDANRSEMARLVFSSVLPLFGTWVGTVLAFYFARESLQAATDSTMRLTGQTDPRTPVEQLMIRKSDIDSFDLKSGQNADSIKLIDLRHAMLADKRQRIPLLTDSGAVIYVIHQSTIDSFAASVKKDPDALTETVSDLLKNPELKKAISAIGFVSRNAVVAEARAALHSVDGCNDVFVTATGQKKEPIIGWLTNTLLAGAN